MRSTVRWLFLPLVLLLPSSAAAATPWTPKAVFESARTQPDAFGEGAPRVGIAADGTTVLAYRRTVSFRPFRLQLRAAAGGRRGRFGSSHLITRRNVSSFSAAAQPGGDRLVAYVASSGIYAATQRDGHWRTHRLVGGPRSGIDAVQVAADPQGGWVLAATRFEKHLTSVQTLSVRADGRPAKGVTEVGAGSFGNEARPVFALTVDRYGTAVLAVRSGEGRPLATIVRVRPHGGGFAGLGNLPGVVDARVTPDPRGGAVLAGTSVVRSGDAGNFGGPVTVRVTPRDRLIDRVEPTLSEAGRAFGPSAVALDGGRRMLTFSLKDGPAAFSSVAPVAAIGVTPSGQTGSTRSLTAKDASEPVVLPLAGGRAVAVWAGSRGWGAARTNRNRVLRPIKPPPGPPPTFVHFNSTNRDVRSAGRFVVVAWERNGRVRVSLRSL